MSCIARIYYLFQVHSEAEDFVLTDYKSTCRSSVAWLLVHGWRSLLFQNLLGSNLFSVYLCGGVPFASPPPPPRPPANIRFSVPFFRAPFPIPPPFLFLLSLYPPFPIPTERHPPPLLYGHGCLLMSNLERLLFARISWNTEYVNQNMFNQASFSKII